MLDSKGKEITDPNPLQPTVPIKKQESIQDLIQKYVRGTLSNKAADDGIETFEESQDFDVENDFDREINMSGYEVVDMEPEYIDQDGVPPTAENLAEPSAETHREGPNNQPKNKKAQPDETTDEVS